MKRSELEKDAAYILDKLEQLDYEVPSNRQILRVIPYKLVIIYVFQSLFIVSGIFINSSISEYRYFDTFVLFLGSNTFFSPALLMSTYNLVNLGLSLGNEITEQSVSLKLAEREINSYSLFFLAVDAIAGCVLLSSGEQFVTELGFSWPVACLISMLMLQTSPSRYMALAVISSLPKVRELLSVSPE